MDDKVTFTFSYAENEVVSAQRMRILHSPQLRGIAILVGVAAVALTAELAYLWHDTGTFPDFWFVPVVVACIFIGVAGFTYLVVPRIDFRINPGWRHEFDLHLSSETFRLTLKGKDEGFELEWHRIKRVLENGQVYLVYFGSGREEFVIVPKRVLKSHALGNRFKSR
jgi:hypothetical protein